MDRFRPLCDGWFLLGALGILFFLGVACEHREGTGDRAPTDTSDGPTPTHVSWEVEFSMTEGGRRRAIIAADRMERYATEDSTYSVWRTMRDTGRVRTYLFDEEGDSSATVVADSVLFFNQEGRFEAFGNVVVVTESDKRLESEHLTWDQLDRRIRTRRFVHITTPTEVVQGNGLVADEDLETYQIGRFTAEVDVESETDEEENE